MRLDGERAAVLGLGRFGGGAGAVRFLAERGARVVVCDGAPAEALAPTLDALSELELELSLGGVEPPRLDDIALWVVNPAVPPDHPLVARARAAGARVTSEIELLLETARSPVLAVSGTHGKSSTVHLAHGLLAEGGLRVRAGGNLGGSLLPEADSLGEDDWLVLELSSYQLEALSTPLRPRRSRVVAAALTTVTRDHLERHGDEERYRAAKRRIFELLEPGGAALVPADEPWLHDLPDHARPVRFHRGPSPDGRGLDLAEGLFRRDGEPLARLEDLRLPGTFQRWNALVALGLAAETGVAPDRLGPALAAQGGLEHRLQDLGRRGGHRVLDNGVSTTPESTAVALETLSPGDVLLAGGQAKALPLAPLTSAAAGLGAAVLFGRDAERLETALRAAGVRTRRTERLEDAVRLAYEELGPGGTLLFSPACASFDAYANFKERALAFRAALPPEDPR